jgi:nucleoside 2-deoxyribosyltransferase
MDFQRIKGMKIYLVHPISGLGYDEVAKYYKETAEFLTDCGFEILSPMTGKSFLRTEVRLRKSCYDNPVATNHAIMERDHWMVNISDIVYANLCGAKEVSIGCMMELAWAYHLGKHMIIAMESNNVHQHAFVLEAADIIFETHQDAVNYLNHLIEGDM